jgi:hypothetical protein
MVNGLRALATLLLLYSIKVSAQDWPAEEWPRDIQAPGPALKALEDYAFVPRDESWWWSATAMIAMVSSVITNC